MCSPHLRNDQQVRGARQQATQQKPKSPFGNISSRFPKFHLTRTPTQRFNTAVPPDRGAYRDRHERAVGCGGRGGARDERAAADGEIVWTGRPMAGVSSLRSSRFLGKTVTTKPSLAGASTYKP